MAPTDLAGSLERFSKDERLQGHAFSNAWRAVLDPWLVERFVEAVGSATAEGLALVAVGGSGRGDFAPGSDLDLLLVHRSRDAPVAVAEKLWYPIWDEGLKLGHAVRTVDEALGLAEENLETATALLAVRHLAGDDSLSTSLSDQARAQWRTGWKCSQSRLRDAVSARQERFGEVAFLLAPALKEGRGGLRDIHALRWAELAHPVLDPGDAAALAEAERVLFEARVALHRVTASVGGRPQDRLELEDQDAVAAALGTDAESLMAGIAAAARTVAWIGDEAWHKVSAAQASRARLLGWRSRERAPGLVVRAGQVHLEPSADPAVNPLLVFEAATLAAGKGVRLARETLARLAERTPPPPEVWPDDLRARFVALLAEGHRAIGPIEALDHVGAWERYLPEWGVVRNRPQRNAYHRFTVDRHLLETVANAAGLVDRVDRPDLLLLGALLHDIGKGRPGDHTEVGMELVVEIGSRLGCSSADTEVLVDLVRHHLLLPDAATRRDLDDPATIEGVAAVVGDTNRLQLLWALTEADSLATGPAAWSRWKADLVRDLVRRVDHHLSGGDPAALSVARFPDDRQSHLLAAGRRSVEGRDDTLEVVAPDRPGLFARVAGVLALHGLDVVAGDATGDGAMALEQFTVTSRFGASIDWDRVIDHVHAALDDRLAIEARLAERTRTYAPSRPGPVTSPATVRFDDAASQTATVVEVHAHDRIGLLFRVLRSFTELGLDVRTAKVQTFGDKVVDSFYVTHGDGTLVTDPGVRFELERSLLHAVTA